MSWLRSFLKPRILTWCPLAHCPLDLDLDLFAPFQLRRVALLHLRLGVGVEQDDASEGFHVAAFLVSTVDRGRLPGMTPRDTGAERRGSTLRILAPSCPSPT